MKKKISGVVAVVALFMLAGFVGGMELDTLTLVQGFIGSMVSLLVFYAAVMIGCGMVEVEDTSRSSSGVTPSVNPSVSATPSQLPLGKGAYAEKNSGINELFGRSEKTSGMKLVPTRRRY